MRILFVIFLSIITYTLNAQVRLLSVDQLDERIANGKDTTYVVNFWATWCTPCIAELPYYEKLNADKFKNPIKVLLISLDFKSKLQKTVIPFITAHNIKSEVFLLNEPNQQNYIARIDKKWSGAIPATLFVYKNKRKFYEKEFTEDELIAELSHLNP